MADQSHRTMGLAGATGVGIGAIVGGGILALAGVAFMTTGPGALAAFAFNGIIALITALSFAELSSRFPHSGGTYTFAKKVLTVEAAFTVGWVVWFASIVAAVLYAIGFAAFAIVVLDNLWPVFAGPAPPWLHDRPVVTAIAALATLAFAFALARRPGGGGALTINVVKVLVFAVLIAGGLWALAGSPAGTIRESLSPFLPNGAIGLVQAMGFTFIALQGFDLIAAVAGEIREPARTIPRAMLLSLGTALVIYLPLLLVIATVGIAPGTTVAEAGAAHPETIVAIAAGRFLGPFGFWLVVAAALLSMLSALQANLFAASRVALAMGRDRTLPPRLEMLSQRHGTPVNAVLVTTLLVVAILVAIPNVAAAGAAASLIFLITFCLAHGINVLARRRVAAPAHVFRTPLFPLFPIVGALLCLGLAVFQAFVVPAAGTIAAVWLGIGAVLFITLFAQRARIHDARSEATDPHLVRLRGRRPLVLVPIANPAHASAMAEVANAMAAPGAGRVMLLNVVTYEMMREAASVERSLSNTETILRGALPRSFREGVVPEALTTVADDVWAEIGRVARAHECESLLLGLSNLDERGPVARLERLLSSVPADAVVLRAAPDWSPASVRRILVAVAGRGRHHILRARLVSSLRRGEEREITYLRVIRREATRERETRVRRVVTRIAHDEAGRAAQVRLIRTDDVPGAITAQAAEHDLVIIGLQRHGRYRKIFGEFAMQIARQTDSALILISSGG